MPVIKTETAYFAGKKFKKVYNVDSIGRFWMKLPDELVTVLDINEKIWGLKLDELDPKYNALIKQYNAAKTTTRKVIVYKFASAAHIYAKADNYEAERREDEDASERSFMLAGMDCILSTKDVSFAEGTVLALAVAVYTEYATQLQTGDVRYHYEFCRSTIPYGADCQDLGQGGAEGDEATQNQFGQRKTCMLAWTPEREAFFASLVTALEGLILKLHEITDDQAKLLAFANRGAMQMLTGPAPPTLPVDLVPQGRRRVPTKPIKRRK